MNLQESVCPYAVGNTINLHISIKEREISTHVRIVKLFEPFTLSCAMVVRIACPELASEGDMVLKLFDRRFAAQLRKDEKLRPWTSGIEKEYHQFVVDGGASHFITEINNNGEVAQQGETWNSSQDEAYLHDHLSDLYETEVRVYEASKDMQGTDIPQVIAHVKLPVSSLVEIKPDSRYVDVCGILLQYIEGFPLTDLANHTPSDCWQSICEEAIQILDRMGDRGILNEDVRTRSFIVKKNVLAQSGYKVVMIDFALCNFREDYADEVEWSEEKAIQDEEGAVGLIMQDRLKGGFVYRRSNRYKKPAHYYE